MGPVDYPHREQVLKAISRARRRGDAAEAVRLSGLDQEFKIKQLFPRDWSRTDLKLREQALGFPDVASAVWFGTIPTEELEAARADYTPQRKRLVTRGGLVAIAVSIAAIAFGTWSSSRVAQARDLEQSLIEINRARLESLFQILDGVEIDAPAQDG